MIKFVNSKPLTAADVSNLTSGLHRVARNLWWTWNQEAQDVFQELSPRGWRNLYHNAVAILYEVSDYELRVHLQEPAFAARVRVVIDRFDAYMGEQNTWGAEHMAHLRARPAAYFSAEFGFHETLPIAAGGLGMLAGDHAKSASDLGLGFVGVSLFYREGYFMQAINQDNWQTEYYTLLNPKNLPIEPVLDAKGEPVVGSVEIATSQVYFKAWRVNVGRIPVYLLDANLPENEDHYRDLTLRVYGGDSSTRIMQEILLGVGGVRLMRLLGISPSVFHMNEGHAAFLSLELAREKVAAGQTLEAALEATKKECVFTTHTPVEAGHDRFSSDLMEFAAHKFSRQLNVSHEQLMDLGRVTAGEETEAFCMTVLALRLSRAANGVSELHGQISRQMWQCLYPDKSVDEVPIGHVTNGVHILGWMKGSVRSFWKGRLGDSWADDVHSASFWEQMLDREFISDEELWALRYRLRRELIEFTRRRLLLQGHSLTVGDYIAFDHLLNPDALTIGFARRFATYKRAPLVFQQFEKVVKLVEDKERPVQFIFAGKAHPRDDEGKKFIQHIIHLSKFSELTGHVVFIENYDVHVARQMVSGCDVWLNNPRRPLEASGTSGQKTSPHGCLNLSIMDGWWREGYDGANGFAIGEDSHPDSVEEQDRGDSENLFRVLTEEVVPCFFNRDGGGIPRQWLQKIRRAMATLSAEYSTWRMVQDYANKYYKVED
ncbi:MAG: Glycogen phosphorylase [Verrucomicrobia subdivision 3 bacterium]|nr:Glycogen phosphorylase [Limisphaerales bacterium]MCS1413762.1 Glycogen phosphorylase [Limisphaerales bacterium]